MKLNFKNLFFAAAALTSAGCNVTVTQPTSPEYYYYYRYPYTYNQCLPDYYTGGLVCDVYYYNADGSVGNVSKDITTDVANSETAMLAESGRLFSEKFSLSEQQGIKLARSLNDFKAVENRNEQDLADFAQRLYGIAPSKIISAVASAQVGNTTEMNSLVVEAAKNFETSPENMREIIKTLHGRALESQGIKLD